MQELIRKLLKLSAPKKVGVTMGAIALVGLMFYQFFYSDTAARAQSALAHRDELEQELTDYKKRQGEVLGYRKELQALQDEQRELLLALPKRAEIPTLLANLHEQAELAGLEVLSVDIGQDVPQDLYVKIPVKIEVRGTFHQTTRFFRNLAELPRVVNIENLNMAPDKDRAPAADALSQAPPKLKTKFVAATFRYADKNDKAKKPGKAAPR